VETSVEPYQSQVPTQVITPDSSTKSATKTPGDTPGAARYWIESAPFQIYDPVNAGVLTEQHACRLVKLYEDSLVHSFPFVVIDTDASSLRQQHPFLFLAILTVAAYDTPSLQHQLADELKRQLCRIIEHSRKSLEILQGLLVYAAWYHTVYRPATQQIAIIIQLCVALTQDLGLSRNTDSVQKPLKWSVSDCAVAWRPKGDLVEKRAYLGSFFLSVV
jgi:hypothetical protein